MENFKSNLKEIRTRKGITQNKLSKLTGISQSYLSDIENIKYDVGLNEMWIIAKALKICPLDLIDCHCKYCKGEKNR